jgi:hypothetical protein
MALTLYYEAGFYDAEAPYISEQNGIAVFLSGSGVRFSSIF